MEGAAWSQLCRMLSLDALPAFWARCCHFCAFLGVPGAGTRHQCSLKVEFRHEQGVGICFSLLVFLGKGTATKAGFAGLGDSSSKGAAQSAPGDFWGHSPSWNYTQHKTHGQAALRASTAIPNQGWHRAHGGPTPSPKVFFAWFESLGAGNYEQC